MKYVVAYSVAEGNDWLKMNQLSPMNYTVVTLPEQLFGIRNPEGVCVGRWRENRHIKKILQTIVINKDKPSDDLIALYNSVL
jgi:hypothetical protein